MCCVYLMLGCGEMCFAEGLCVVRCIAMEFLSHMGGFSMSKGSAPAALIYSGSRVTCWSPSRLRDRCPSRLQLYLLCTRKVRFYPYSDRSFMQSCTANSPCVSRLESS